MKKLFAYIFTTLLAFSVFSVELETRIVPELNIPFQKTYKVGVGGVLSLDLIPTSFRLRDTLAISAQGGANFVPVNVIAGKEFDQMNFFRGGLACSYNFRFSDRMSLQPEIGFGLWALPQVPSQLLEYINQKNPETPVTNKDIAPSGLYVSFNVGFNFYLRPELSLFADIGYSNFLNKPKSYFSDLGIGVGVKYNLNKGLFSKADLQFTNVETNPLFPVFYSRYDTNKFGTIAFVSNEKNTITDIEVSLFISQYMTNPKVISTIENMAPGEEQIVDLTAFLNESILASMLSRKADAELTIKYKSLGKTMVYKQTIELQALSRNSMTWEDDRRAAAFVSGRDAAALKFARQVVSVIKNEISPNKPLNLQYAAAIFGALKAYGISYVIDPSSAFTDNVGSSSIDFLQFPYQTLLYHGGDCDDLTILNCSLLEALGVKTAFITVPGHIFMAFDSGVSLDEADSKLGKNKYIVKNGTVWVPVEITVSQDTFSLARSIGSREWRKYEAEAQLIEMEYAWLEYKPVSIPESDISLQMPSRDRILKEFREAMN